jgi:hypothetical protein
MVGMAMVRGAVVVADSGISHHAFLGDLGLGHAQSPVAILDALPSFLCR